MYQFLIKWFLICMRDSTVADKSYPKMQYFFKSEQVKSYGNLTGILILFSTSRFNFDLHAFPSDLEVTKFPNVDAKHLKVNRDFKESRKTTRPENA